MNKISVIFISIWMFFVGCIFVSIAAGAQPDIKKEFNVVIADECPSDYVIIVEWTTGMMETPHTSLCNKLLYSKKMNQYMLVHGDKFKTIEFINCQNLMYGPVVIVIPVNEIKNRDSFVERK